MATEKRLIYLEDAIARIVDTPCPPWMPWKWCMANGSLSNTMPIVPVGKAMEHIIIFVPLVTAYHTHSLMD